MAAVMDVPTGDGTQFLQPLPPPPRPLAPGPPALPTGHTPSIASVPNPTMAATDDNRFTEAAEHVLNTVGERTVWQGTPSMLYLIKPALGWALFIAIVTIGLAQLTIPFDWGWGILALGVFALLKIGTAWLRLHNTRYRLSSQRLEKNRRPAQPHHRHGRIDEHQTGRHHRTVPLAHVWAGRPGTRRRDRRTLEALRNSRRDDRPRSDSQLQRHRWPVVGPAQVRQLN